MKIVVSACLLGENCKYNGGNNYNEKLIEFLKGHEVISVCPECLGGLPTPRIPAEIVNGNVINRENISVDKEYRLGASIALKMAMDADLVILQSRSPSCGVDIIYDGTFTGNKISGDGIFVQMLKKENIPVLDVSKLDEYILK